MLIKKYLSLIRSIFLSGVLLLILAAMLCMSPVGPQKIFQTASAAQIKETISITLPPCDFIIQTAVDWSHVNDVDKRVICVAPHVYTFDEQVQVELRASGSANAPRYLRWYDPANPNDQTTHPVHMAPEKQAGIAEVLVFGDYWIIDRLVIRDTPASNQIYGSHNIFNRVLMERSRGTTLYFYSGTGNVLQNSVLRDPVTTPYQDSWLIYSHEDSDTTIQGNELYNASGYSTGPLTKGGHRIIDNDIYLTNAVYSDCNGTKTPTGLCAAAEFGMALKGPADAQGTLISGNRIWGYRTTDSKLAGSGSPGTGLDFGSYGFDAVTGLGGPTETGNFIVTNNDIFDGGTYGVYIGANVHNIVFQGNVITGWDYGFSNGYAKLTNIIDNFWSGNRIMDFNDYGSLKTSTGLVERNGSLPASYCITRKKITAPEKYCLAGSPPVAVSPTPSLSPSPTPTSNPSSVSAPAPNPTPYNQTPLVSTPVPQSSPTISVISPALSSATESHIVAPLRSTTTFSRNLKYGMSGSDVLRLQQFLNTHGLLVAKNGPGSFGNETVFFGNATLKAVIRFQEMYKSEVLAPAGLKNGTGYVGPGTLKKINTILSKNPN